MPLLSAFTPLGMLRLSGEPSHAERIYRSITSGLSGQFAVDEGSRYDAFAYAEAMKLARIKYAAEHAAGQALPAGADVLLPVHERDFGIVPGPTATLSARRTVLASMWRHLRQPTRYEVETALRALLGDDFLALVTTHATNAVLHPATLTTSPCLLANPRAVRKMVRFLSPVAFITTDVEVEYEPILGDGRADGATDLDVGEYVVVDPDVPGLIERVLVESVRTEGERRFFTADFDFPHHTGCSARTGNWPYQRSTKRHSIIVVSPDAAVDPTARRAINAYMSRVARASSTWDIVQGSSGTTGTFTVGSSPAGAETISPITY